MVRDNNPNYGIDNLFQCEATQSTGAVTVLLTARDQSFGHLALVVHEDQNLFLPADLDTEHFVSFWPEANVTGAIITGTKAKYDGFGNKLKHVTQVTTLHNADTDAMIKKWQSIKDNNQMFDIIEWNCARTVMEVLREGYPSCDFPIHKLMTPDQAFAYIEQVHV